MVCPYESSNVSFLKTSDYLIEGLKHDVQSTELYSSNFSKDGKYWAVGNAYKVKLLICESPKKLQGNKLPLEKQIHEIDSMNEIAISPQMISEELQ